MLTASKISTPLALSFLAGALLPTVAYAEPRPSLAHMPVLWLVAAVGALLFALIPFLIKKLIGSHGTRWAFWVVSVGLGILFLIFIGPIIVGLGSILITGRTM